MLTLAEFDLPSLPGNERLAAQQVLAALKDIELTDTRRRRLETAVAETAMNAMEHGNKYQADFPVHITVQLTSQYLKVRILDHGSGEEISPPETPDLDAKLAGLQSPRGWGLFLIKNMVDEVIINEENEHHVVELVMNLEGG